MKSRIHNQRLNLMSAENKRRSVVDDTANRRYEIDSLRDAMLPNSNLHENPAIHSVIEAREGEVEMVFDTERERVRFQNVLLSAPTSQKSIPSMA